MPIQRVVDQVNDSAAKITSNNVLLSHANLTRLEELNTRWRLIQMACDERLRSVDTALADHGANQQQFLTAAVEHPWERAVAPNKVPYYIK